MKDNPSPTPLTSLTLIVNFFLLHGITRWANSSSGIRRALYAYSHPVIVACLLTYVICFTEVGISLASVAPMKSLIVWCDAAFSFALAFSAKSSFPQQSKLFFDLWILLAPIMTVFLAARIAYVERLGWYKRWALKSLRWQLSMTIVLSLTLVAGVLGAFIPGDAGFCKGCTTHSRFGLFVIYGIGMPGAIGLLLAAIPSLLIFVTRRK